jgi:hypothetical protein
VPSIIIVDGINIKVVGFEVFTVVAMKNAVFWGVALWACSLALVLLP